MIRIVVAKSLNDVIGVNGEMPWILPPDLKNFKKITTDQVGKNIVVMGRKTWESIGEVPLPNRINVVISRRPRNLPRKTGFSNVIWLNDCSDVLKIFNNKKDVINIIGGETIYRYFLPVADELFITEVFTDIVKTKNKNYTMFPKFSPKIWRNITLGEVQEFNGTAFRFNHYTR